MSGTKGDKQLRESHQHQHPNGIRTNCIVGVLVAKVSFVAAMLFLSHPGGALATYFLEVSVSFRSA